MCVQCQISLSLSLFCLFVCFLVVVDFEEKILHEKKEAKNVSEAAIFIGVVVVPSLYTSSSSCQTTTRITR